MWLASLELTILLPFSLSAEITGVNYHIQHFRNFNEAQKSSLLMKLFGIYLVFGYI